MTQKIPTNPSFHPAIEKWFAEKFGSPSPPQVRGWPVIASGENALILAPTGSGKTLAAFLWCIDDLFHLGLQTESRAFQQNSHGVHTLYISPLKALNNDIHINLQEPLTGISRTARTLGYDPPKIRTLVRTGDTPAHVRTSMVKNPPHILITTPESFYLLLTSEKGRPIFRNVKYVIIDEIHALCNSKRGVHLSLSLERLTALCHREPLRIGLSATQRPLNRIASFLGGQSSTGSELKARPVTVVDCGHRKDIDVRVISPVESFGDLPEGSVWPAVIDTLYKFINSHRTTLVFVNMRAQTEKIARQLNEKKQNETGNPDAEIALAHHGSISREMRGLVEDRLKKGEIPAVIATASLELGIDIGSIDLVIQLESPKSVTSALQRIGRSGHLLRSTSQGRIIPLYPADLDDAVAFVESITRSDIEETVIPENCLDVLSQQILAEVAMQNWSRTALYRRFCQSYCYRHLSEFTFNSVVEMLAGKYSNEQVFSLLPRLTWDRINDKLIARRGARLSAILNGGTIPDRGYYGVYLQGDNTRLGEVEEEFVFESRVGDVFFLGSSEWRIAEIHRDRIFVTPLRSAKPRAPFWKGEPLYRDYATSQKIGAFRRNLVKKIDEHRDSEWLMSNCRTDAATAKNLREYFIRQKEITGLVPTDTQLIIEYFRDSSDELQVIVHAPFGGRVNGAWATALGLLIEKKVGAQVQYGFDDDGLIFRFLDVLDPPDLGELLSISDEEIEKYLYDGLLKSSLFAVFFRHNATRAMLLPRSRTGKRIPLWIQRLRASDLLQTVTPHGDFPIVIETFRECLYDVFDLKSLKRILKDIRGKKITVHRIETSSPSPMASGLLFRFMAEHLYQYDVVRTAAQAANISSALFNEVLKRENLPTLITEEIVDTAKKRWQHLSPVTKAADQEDLFAIIEQLGPISEQELIMRSSIDPSQWMENLKRDNRILHITAPLPGWIAAEEKDLYARHREPESLRELIRRFLWVNGPVTLSEIRDRFFISKEILAEVLDGLKKDDELVTGQLTVGSTERQYCDHRNFTQLYRQTVVIRRQARAPAERAIYHSFLLAWHQVAELRRLTVPVLARYSGLRMPPFVLEREILASRLVRCENEKDVFQLMDELVGKGEIIVRAHRETENNRTTVDFIQRGQGHLFDDPDHFTGKVGLLPPAAKEIVDFLNQNGASPVRDLLEGTELNTGEIESSLAHLVREGLVSCDDYRSFHHLLSGSRSTVKNEDKNEPWRQDLFPTGRRGSKLRASRRVHLRNQSLSGRWFLTSSFAVMGRALSEEKRAESQALLLLQRYGILIKEWYRRETGLMPWYPIFQALKKMEWQGRVRRGYFIRGLSGLQFALPEAVELLEKLQCEDRRVTKTAFLCTVDPALPFGRGIGWDILDRKNESVPVVRSPINFLLFIETQPAMYCENYGARIWLCKNWNDRHAVEAAKALKNLLRVPAYFRPRGRLEISRIENEPASHNPLARSLVDLGFESSGDKLILWPSAL